MSAICPNVADSRKLCCFATFCPKQTQNLPVQPVSGGEPRTDHPHEGEKTSERFFGSVLPFLCKKQKLRLFIVFFTYLVDCM